MYFKDIAGQNDLKIKLLNMAGDNRIGHAIMFAGKEGNGMLGLAIALARYINCLDPGETDSCSVCSSCRKFDILQHPDLHFAFPVAKNKDSAREITSDEFLPAWREALLDNPYLGLFQWFEKIGVENKQGAISRNESRLIVKKLSLKNFEARYKVMIIWMAEKMNIYAANELLKIVEEPPPGTLFIFITENINQIIPTILSRTQLIRVPGIDDVTLNDILEREFGIKESAEKNSIIRQSGGSYNALLNALNSKDEVSERFQMFVRLMRFCYLADIPSISGWVEEISGFGREKQKHFLEYALKLLRGNLIMNTEVEDIEFLSDEEREFSKKFSIYIHPGNAPKLYEEFNLAHSHIESNGYGRLVFFDLAIKTARLLKS